MLDGRGKELWTKQPGGYLFGPTAVADLDGDGKPEIVVAGGRLHVFDLDGREKWRSAEYGSIARGVAIADVGGDGQLDLLFGAHDRKFHVLNGRSGKEMLSFDATARGHVYESIDSGPVVGDFGRDGTLGVFFVAGKGTSDKTRAENYGRAYVLKLGPGKGSWPMFRGNLKRTGTR